MGGGQDGWTEVITDLHLEGRSKVLPGVVQLVAQHLHSQFLDGGGSPGVSQATPKLYALMGVVFSLKFLA